MSEHLGNAERAVMTSAVLALCDYTCEWADDATLFALMAALAQYAAQAAARLDTVLYLSRPPSDIAQAQMGMPTPRNAGGVSTANALGGGA